MTTEVTDAMVDAVDWNSGHPFPAYQQNPAAWMNAIVALAIKKARSEIRQAEREAIAATWETDSAEARTWEAEDVAAAIRARGDTDVT